MIVKVQRSLYSSSGEERVLIYNEDRSFEAEFVMYEGLRSTFATDEVKYFAHAEIDDDGELVLLKEADWQSW